MHKGEASKETKNLESNFFLAAFVNPANEFVSTSIGKTRFYTNFFEGKRNPRAVSLATSFASRDSELLGTSPTQKKNNL